MLLLPCLQKKERDRARRVYGQSGDASVNPFKPTLSAMSVACMRPKSAYSLDCCRQPAQDFPHVVDDLLREIGTIGEIPNGSLTARYKPPMSLRWGSGRPNSSRIERHMLSTVEHAAVTASSGSYSALSRHDPSPDVRCRSLGPLPCRQAPRSPANARPPRRGACFARAVAGRAHPGQGTC